MRRKRIEAKRRAEAAAEAANFQDHDGIEMKSNPLTSNKQAASSATKSLTPQEKKAALARHKKLSKPILGSKKDPLNKEMEAHVGNLRSVSLLYNIYIPVYFFLAQVYIFLFIMN